MPNNILETIDRLKQELDEFRPLPADVIARAEQKLRIESNYHTNAIEGNSLTLGETRSLILHGLTAHGKPMRDTWTSKAMTPRSRLLSLQSRKSKP